MGIPVISVLFFFFVLFPFKNFDDAICRYCCASGKNSITFNKLFKMKTETGLIGIAGGMGPSAGIDLSSKIVDQTIASKDQEHIPQILYSDPGAIGDRTEYILGKIKENPAYNIAKILVKLESAGAVIACLACNSAHAPQIFDVVEDELAKKGSSIKLFHIIDEVGKFIKFQYPDIRKVGILGTSGTYKTKQYSRIERFGLEAVNVSPEEQDKVHNSIYHPEYGIKSLGGVVSCKSRSILEEAALSLKEKGAGAAVLGCTELPLAFSENSYKGMPLIDASLVLARALIHAHSPNKLKPWDKQ